MQVDFGSSGIGGNVSTTAGNGYYALEFDLDNNGSFESVRNFYRLLGDTNGDLRVDSIDYAFATSRLGGRGDNQDADVNGDGFVNLQDQLAVRRGIGQVITGTLRLDD